MQPLSRQESRPSIYSWWSDSNPGLQGPTINLHAAAKPLSRFLYHRQVLDIITKNSGIPLSALTLEIYSSYFPLDYVSWSTKATILAELADRSTSEVEARAVVDSPVFPYVAQMLGSPDPGVRISSCRLLGCLLLQESTAPAVLELQPWEQLVSLLSDKRPRVSGVAASVLCELSKSTADAQAIVNANATDHIFMLLGSPNPETLRETCELVERLASHDSTAPAILKLVARIMRYEDSWVIGWAVNILSTMAQSEDGAQAIIDANTTNHILILLQSPRSGVRELACELVERLASRKCIAPVMERIVILLYPSTKVIEQATRWATYILAQIARSVGGAEAIIDEYATDRFLALLKSPRRYFQIWACELVGRLASHESTAPAVLEMKPCRPIVRLLLHSSNSDVIQSATYALSQIGRWPGGAQAIIEAKAADHSLFLLECPNSGVQGWTSELLGGLVNRDSTALAILNACVQILSSGEYSERDIERASHALSEIARWEYGAQAIVDAKATGHIFMLLESSNPHILRRTCELVGRLARHESAAPAVLELNLSARIVSLMGVIELDTHSLVELARWEGDPLAFVKKADHILTLLELPSSRVRESTGDLQLISLLGDLDEAIRNNVISALEAISESPDGPGVACLIAMDIERLTRLSHDQSLDPESQVRIRKIRDNVAQHQAGRALQLQEIPVRAADNSWSHGTMPPLDGVRVEIARFRSN